MEEEYIYREPPLEIAKAMEEECQRMMLLTLSKIVYDITTVFKFQEVIHNREEIVEEIRKYRTRFKQKGVLGLPDIKRIEIQIYKVITSKYLEWVESDVIDPDVVFMHKQNMMANWSDRGKITVSKLYKRRI